MINAIKDDIEMRFGGISKENGMWLQIAHTESEQAAEILKQELLMFSRIIRFILIICH